MPRYVQYTLLGKRRWGIASESEVQGLRGDLFVGDLQPEGDPVPHGSLALLPPSQPSKIVCVGRNYRAHAAELNHPVPQEPLLFLKPPSCLVGPNVSIVIPDSQTQLVHHEGELAIVMGRRAKHVTVAKADAYVLGYTLMNDVTARDLQRRDVQFTRAKSFDTFGPCGPWIDTDFTPGDQRLTVTVNGELRQSGRLSEMVFSPQELIARISRIMTLEPGDIISTGTPAGVGPLLAGDVVCITLEGLGSLSNPVISEES
jgi:2-keto-4-pentenoate hydratase/2-oxohepta-3-ene-1,7-dioic acid hydratase in catechol pathway